MGKKRRYNKDTIIGTRIVPILATKDYLLQLKQNIKYV